MLRKLKKVFPAVVSALLCAAMVLGITASAADTDKELWKSAKSAAGLKYHSDYIKWADKYSEKEAKNTVVYAKSRTKKFLDKITAKAASDSPKYSLGLIDGESMLCYTIKDGCLKYVMLMDGEGNAIFVDKNSVTIASINDKTKVTVRADGEDDEYLKKVSDKYTEIITDDVADTFDFEISENEKGKIFKFKSDEKIYYYEEFECGSGFNSVGFVFTEKGTPIAMTVDNATLCISFRTNIDDSEFDVPKGYTDIDIDDFE